MKQLLYMMIALGMMVGCNSTQDAVSKDKGITTTEQDTIRIANEELEYEIIIIEPGFNTWLMSIAKPEGYYSQQFMEGRNRQYVMEWNRRVLTPSQFSNLYLMQIDYDPHIDYGYEVNYKLYNYFIYFQLQYRQRLGPYFPRI